MLLVVALLFLVTAARELFSDEDPNAPPPKWMTMLTSATPTKAFFIGAGVITVSVKAWVFTLAAISAIGNAEFGPARQHRFLRRLCGACLERQPAHRSPHARFSRAFRSLLDRVLRWLQDHDRTHHDRVGLVFGIWFGIKALRGFGIL